MKYNKIKVNGDYYYVAKTDKGLTFLGHKNRSFEDLKNYFPKEELILSNDFKDVETQLKEYFLHKRKNFNLKFDLIGTEFQVKVWKQLLKIEYGKTKAYSKIALELGDKKKTRAVSNAIAKNPLPIVIPCHRVIGLNGELRGFGGGLELKSWLLNHEKDN
ncbi:MAG: methylated-DNA--[protein]-cysteine S-methyltransferase [Bacilli bacterium]